MNKNTGKRGKENIDNDYKIGYNLNDLRKRNKINDFHAWKSKHVNKTHSKPSVCNKDRITCYSMEHCLNS